MISSMKLSSLPSSWDSCSPWASDSAEVAETSMTTSGMLREDDEDDEKEEVTPAQFIGFSSRTEELLLAGTKTKTYGVRNFKQVQMKE
jgi:hypothetical protein